MFLKLLAISMLVHACINTMDAAQLCVSVTDYADLPLSGASVTTLNLTTAEKHSSRTDRKGDVCLPSLPEGSYSVEVGLQGFMNVRYYPVRPAFPIKTKLSFRLPFAEITEGGLASESTISGTCRVGNKPAANALVCLVKAGSNPRCTTANHLGEYLLSVPPAVYELEVATAEKRKFKSKVDLSTPGSYPDLAIFPER